MVKKWRQVLRVITEPTFWIGAVCLTAPLNWFYKLNETTAYAGGLFIDYLLIRIYTTDLLLLVWAGVLLAHHHQRLFPFLRTVVVYHRQKFEIWALASVGLLFVAQVWVGGSLSVLWLVRFAFWALFSWWCLQQRRRWHIPTITMALLVVLLTQTTLGLVQWVRQAPLGGYWLGGETNLTAPGGLARTEWWGSTRVLAYGTSPHPNVLAGSMVGYFLALYALLPQQQRRATLIIGGLCVSCTLLITQSVSALLAGVFLTAMMVVPSLKSWFKILGFTILSSIPVLLFLSTLATLPLPTSITRRSELQQLGLEALLEKPFIGIGLGRSAELAANQPLSRELSRFAQPPHHALIVWLVETGVLGALCLVLCGVILSRYLQWSPLLWSLAPLVALDHYILTLNAGIVLCFILVLTTSTLKERS